MQGKKQMPPLNGVGIFIVFVLGAMIGVILGINHQANAAKQLRIQSSPQVQYTPRPTPVQTSMPQLTAAPDLTLDQLTQMMSGKSEASFLYYHEGRLNTWHKVDVSGSVPSNGIYVADKAPTSIANTCLYPIFPTTGPARVMHNACTSPSAVPGPGMYAVLKEPLTCEYLRSQLHGPTWNCPKQ